MKLKCDALLSNVAVFQVEAAALQPGATPEHPGYVPIEHTSLEEDGRPLLADVHGVDFTAADLLDVLRHRILWIR